MRCLRARRRGGAIEEDRVGDADRFIASERFDRDVQRDAQAGAGGANARDGESRANARSGAHRGEKTNAVEPVIQCRTRSADTAATVPEDGEQREHEISMGDRAAIRPLGGAARIDVNPLPILGAFCKCVDPSLIDPQPRRRDEFGALECAKRVETLHDFRSHLPISLRKRSHDAPVDYRTFPH